MVKVSTAEFRKGMHIVYRDEPWQIAEMEFVNPGKGSAFYRTKLRNVGTGRTVDFTFKSGESVEQYDVYSKDGESYQVLLHDDEGIGLRMPKRVVLTVEYTEDAARGNTVANVLKPAQLDNGVTVMVPAFVKNGDRIAVNPETREYLERAN